MTEKAEGSLRALMPQTAALIDHLRKELGREQADAIVLGGKQGKGTFRAVETGPDGVRRVFGSMTPTKWPGGADGAA